LIILIMFCEKYKIILFITTAVRSSNPT
jgi:hypothetical protein